LSALISFTIFIKRAHESMLVKHQAIDKWESFVEEHIGYTDSITNLSDKLKYLERLSSVYFPVGDMDSFVEYCDKLDVIRQEI